MGHPLPRVTEETSARMTLVPPPKPSRSRRFNWRRALRSVLILIAAVFGVVSLGLAAVWFGLRLAGPGRAPGVAKGAAGSLPGAAPGSTRVLLIGADERPGDPGRGDVAMIASVDPARKQVRLLSIPRDAWTQVPGHGWTKFNHAFAFGKEDLTRKTVERLIGLPVDHHVVVNMDGFRRIVDLLGGVSIDVEKDMKYDDPYDDPPLHINLRKGRQRLDGERALHYVRFRSDGDGDTGRVHRQQVFLRAIAAEATKPQNLTKLPSLISAAYGAVRTDLPASDLVRLAVQYGPEAKDYAIEATTLPGTDLWVDGVSYLQLDLGEARRLAYRTLVGADPDDSFLAQARRDAQAYAASARESGGSSAPPANGRSSGAAGTNGNGATGGGRQTTPPGSGASANPGGRTTSPGLAQPVALRVIDASGARAFDDRYRTRLESNGFRVVRVSRSQLRQARTTILWRGGPAEAVQKLQALLPQAVVVRAPSPDAATPIELVLGVN